MKATVSYKPWHTTTAHRLCPEKYMRTPNRVDSCTMIRTARGPWYRWSTAAPAEAAAMATAAATGVTSVRHLTYLRDWLEPDRTAAAPRGGDPGPRCRAR